MKKLLLAIVLLLGVGVAGVYFASSNLGVVAKMALEHWGPSITGTPMSVESVQVSAREGRGVIRGFEIGSPAGYSAKRAMRLGEVRIAFDPLTITSPVTLVHEIVVDAPQITFERGGKAVNLDAIQDRIEAHVKRMAALQDSSWDPQMLLKHRFIIERLEVRGGRVLMTNAALKGQGVSFDLPEVQLRDVGKRQGGVTAAQAAALVMSVVQLRIAEKALDQKR